MTATLSAKPTKDHGTVAVLVVSCDKYRDLWAPCFTLFFRYWADCPYPVYLLSNSEKYPDTRVMPLTVGRDRNWSSNLAYAMRKITNQLILVMMEDYLLDGPVDTSRILFLENYMKLRKAGCLRLFPSPGPDSTCPDNPQVGELRKGAPYRLSLQVAIWDKHTLLSLLRWGETAWDLEVLGSRRTNSLDAPFLSVQRNIPAITYRNAIIRGEWDPRVLEFCQQQNVTLEQRNRPLRGPRKEYRLSDRLRIMFHKRIIFLMNWKQP